MISSMRIWDIAREFREAGALRNLVSPAYFLSPDNGQVVTKRGDIFSVLRIQGRDSEGMDEPQVDRICRRYEKSMTGWGEDFRVYNYMFRRPVDVAWTSYDRLSEARGRQLQQSRMFSVELYTAILRHKRQVELDSFGVDAIREYEMMRLKRMEAELDYTVRGFQDSMHDLFAPEVLDQRETLSFLRTIANVDPNKAEVYGKVPQHHLDLHTVEGHLDIERRHLEMDGRYILMLSMVIEPRANRPDLFRDLQKVECGMTVVQEWAPASPERTLAMIDKMRRHYHYGKRSFRSRATTDKRTRTSDILVDSSKEAIVKLLDAAKIEITTKEQHFGKFSIVVMLYDESQEVVERAAARVRTIFASNDGSVKPETYNSINAWASMFPGGYAFQRREKWVLNPTFADEAMIWQPAAGEKVNQHLGQPYLDAYQTEQKTIFYVNLHQGQVGHALAVGMTGSGKSFALNALISAYQRYKPYVVIFDIGGQFTALTREYGGSYIHVGRRDNGISMNPLALELTPANKEFLFQWCSVIIGRKGYVMTDADNADLHRKIDLLEELDPSVRRLESLANTCSQTYRSKFDEFVGHGRLAWCFDNVEDNLRFSNFQAFNFQGMKQSAKELMEPVMFYILHLANTVTYNPALLIVPKLIVIDEAWAMLEHPLAFDYANECIKTGRKHNLAIILATQSRGDLEKVGLWEAVSEEMPTKIFFANPGMDRETYRREFHLTRVQTEAISKLIPARQMLWTRPPSESKILNLIVDEESKKVFSNA
jgi:type IV secretion system protein TrbE